MEIPFRGQYTEEDIRRGLALIRGRAFQIAGIGIGLVIALGILPTVLSILAGEADAFDVLSAILPALLVSGFFAFLVWWVPRSQSRKLLEAPLFRGTVTGVATDEALELRSEQSEGKTQWGAFVQHKMSDEVVLLYQTHGAAHIMPRSLFASDEDWQQFQEHVRATVPEKAKAQGGILRWRWLLYLVLALIVLGAILAGLLGCR